MLKKACQRFGLTKANLRNIPKNARKVLLRIMFPSDENLVEHPVREVWFWVISSAIAFYVSMAISFSLAYHGLLQLVPGILVTISVFLLLLIGVRWVIFLVSRPIARAIRHIWDAIPEERENH